MAGGKAYCEGTISIGGAVATDLIDWNFVLGGTLLSNRSDGRRYPQIACSVDHSAEVGFKTYDLTQGAQASSSVPLIGKLISGGVILTADDIAGSSMVLTISPARCSRANGQGGHAKLADMDLAYEAVGQGGVEPTVTFANVV